MDAVGWPSRVVYVQNEQARVSPNVMSTALLHVVAHMNVYDILNVLIYWTDPKRQLRSSQNEEHWNARTNVLTGNAQERRVPAAL